MVSNEVYDILDVAGDGSCFYRALYVVLKENDKIMDFIKCIHKRSGLDKNVPENIFVEFVRKTLSNKTTTGKDENHSEDTYTYLKSIYNPKNKEMLETYNLQIDSSFAIDQLRTLPTSLTAFRRIIGNYLQNISCYANQYDIDLITKLCNSIKFHIFNDNPPSKSYNFDHNIIYLLRVNNNHYRSIILKKNK